MEFKIKRFIKKNKKLLIIISSILLLALIILGVVLLNIKHSQKEEIKKDNSNEPKVVEELKFMTVKINPYVKIGFKESYEMCDDHGSEFICSDITKMVVSFEFLNDDAQKYYENKEFIGKTLEEVLVNICDIAKENKITFNTVEIETNSEYVDKTELMQYIVLHAQNSIDYTLDFKVVKEEEENNEVDDMPTVVEDVKTYKVTFDSNGGSKVSSQSVKEGGKASAPENPTKEGYTFVEWELNGKKFNFSNKITKDITLVAKWNEAENNIEEYTKTFEKFNVEIKNLESGLKAEIVGGSIKVTAKGSNKDIVNSKNAGSIKVYVDLSGLKEGSHSADIKQENIDNDVTYTFEPNKVTVNIQKITENDNKFNLNENIEYYTTQMSPSCSYYIYVKPNCLNKTYQELKDLYPNYDKELDKLENINDNEKVSDFTYFPECKTIPSDTLSKLQNLPGSILSQEGDKILFGYIQFFADKYISLVPEIDYSQYGLVFVGGCGDYGYQNPSEGILTNELCEKYHLSCGEW